MFCMSIPNDTGCLDPSLNIWLMRPMDVVLKRKVLIDVFCAVGIHDSQLPLRSVVFVARV